MFLFSRSIANISDSIYFLVLLWGVQTATHSTMYTGFAYSAITAASLSVILFGPYIDRFSPGKLSSISLFIQAVIIFIISVLFQFDNIIWWLIIFLIFIASIFSNIFYPANTTLFTQIVPMDEYQTGNSIISSLDQSINLLGFVLGGSIIIWIGATNTYILSATLMIVASLMYFFVIKGNHSRKESKSSNYFDDFKIGFNFIKTIKYMKILLTVGSISNAIMAMIVISLPAIGQEYGSPLYYSLIYVLFFIGFILGALLSNFTQKTGLSISLAWICNGLCLIFISLNFSMYINFLCMLLFGVSSGILNIIQYTFEQTMTPANLMGRVTSTIGTLNNIATPIGAFIGGILIAYFSINVMFLICGVIITILGIILSINREFKSFNIEKAKIIKLNNS